MCSTICALHQGRETFQINGRIVWVIAINIMLMKTLILPKLSTITLVLLFLASCSKQEDSALTNLKVERTDNSRAMRMEQKSISTDMVLGDHVNGVDYIIKENVEVSANLTIMPGVTIQFEDNAGLQINQSGSIRAIGANGNLIYFTSKSGKRSSWKGITILSTSNKNSISYAKIEHGGADNSFGTGNLIIGNARNLASLELSNSEITASGTIGITLGEASKLTGFVANKIHTNSSYPVSLCIADAGNMNDLNELRNNGKEFFRFTGSSSGIISKEITLGKLLEPVLITGTVVAGNKFNLLAGTRIAMDEHAEIIIDGIAGNGSFSAIGTSSQPITIAAPFTGSGVWNSIRFRSSNSALNRIEYCNISGGGGSNSHINNGMITVVNDNGGSGNITIRNSSITNSAASGIFIQNSASVYNKDIVSSNSFSNNANGNVYFE